MAIIERLAPPVDPPEAERAVEHLRVAHAVDARTLLGHLDPHTVRDVVVLEPLLPVAGGGEEDRRETVLGAHRSRLA